MKEVKKKGRHPMDDIQVRNTKICFRLDVQELAELDKAVRSSGSKSRSEYLKTVVFNRSIRVVTVDKGLEESWKILNDLQCQYRKFGNNYNQIVKVLHTTFGEKKALAMLYKLENLTIELVKINKEIISVINKNR